MNHSSRSAKNQESDTCATRKVLKPSKEVEEKMQPLARNAFDNLLRKAVNSPAQKPAAKHRWLGAHCVEFGEALDGLLVIPWRGELKRLLLRPLLALPHVDPPALPLVRRVERYLYPRLRIPASSAIFHRVLFHPSGGPKSLDKGPLVFQFSICGKLPKNQSSNSEDFVTAFRSARIA
jgi:hypothetical protein